MGVVVIAAALVLAQFVRSATEAKEKTIALYLAESGIEYIKQIRSEDWTNISSLTNGTTYYFNVSTTSIATSVSPEVIDGYYQRSFELSSLRRDTSGDILSTGGTVDADSRYVVVTVNYGGSSLEVGSILTNLHDE